MQRAVRMKEHKRRPLIRQIIRPLVLFIILLILSNGIFLFYYNLRHSKEEVYNTADKVATTTSNVMREYKSLDFLVEYWEKNYESMDLFYDDPSVYEAKERKLAAMHPYRIDMTQITNTEARSMDPAAQKLFAELCYSDICSAFSKYKEIYDLYYMYSFDIIDSDMFFLNTGIKDKELRISQGGELFELGYKFVYNPGEYPILDEILRTQKRVYSLEMSQPDSAVGSVVHAFAPVYGVNNNVIAIVGVSIGLEDLQMKALRPAIIISIVSAVLFTLVVIAIYLLVKSSVAKPVDAEETIMHNYEKNKNATAAINALSNIKSNNEIEDLAKSFSSMIAEIDRYMGEIKSVTAEKERIKSELSMAASIQSSQLPNTFPAFPNRNDFSIYATMTPAKEVGGDFYDFYMIDDDHLALVIADVSGKGIPAALFMMISRILIKNHMQSGEDPAEALYKVNNQLLENNEADLFVTVWLAKVELSTGKVLVSNAGHEYPVVKRADGRFEIIKYRHSPPVSTIRNMKFEQHEAQIGPGDCIFVYTDGVAEATNSSNELFGTDRLITCLNSRSNTNPVNILERVMKSIKGFVMEAEQFDDITMLCFKYTGADDKEENN